MQDRERHGSRSESLPGTRSREPMAVHSTPGSAKCVGSGLTSSRGHTDPVGKLPLPITATVSAARRPAVPVRLSRAGPSLLTGRCTCRAAGKPAVIELHFRQAARR